MHFMGVFSERGHFVFYTHEDFLAKFELFTRWELMGLKLIKFSIPIIYDLGSV